MTSWPPFPQPIGPLRAVNPRTGRTATPGDLVRHLTCGPGTVTGAAWDGLVGMAVPVVHLDGTPHAHPYVWDVIEFRTP
ncbi:hypothetical protein [Streptomyces sp. NRRL F-525]|uniref:hypothetical protein n=1 Tax=Streptomyces sp. NRRL F-525 TaxID=1463861 RepID=UPI0005253496|nr:hypothetical protein [Streptomyces sp. NRRL F-525]